jgi:hypothetical protein
LKSKEKKDETTMQKGFGVKPRVTQEKRGYLSSMNNFDECSYEQV